MAPAVASAAIHRLGWVMVDEVHAGKRRVDERSDCASCSVRSRSPPAVVLTVSAIKPTFGSAAGAGPNGSYPRCC